MDYESLSKFKNGDFVFVETNPNHLSNRKHSQTIAIIRGYNKECVYVHCSYYLPLCAFLSHIGESELNHPWARLTSIESMRAATTKEKTLLFEKIDEWGYEWDADGLELRKKA